MINVTVLGSGSKGNCYVFESKNSCLLVEAGIKLSEVKKAIGFNVSKICGCIVTHEHKDHSGYIGEYLRNGIKCYTSGGTIEALGIESSYLCKIAPYVSFSLADWRILPFNTKHDCTEPFGYMLNNRQCGNILFATDTFYLPNTFKNLNNIFIECNYSKEILDNNNINDSLKKRLFGSHLSLDTCIKALKANDLSNVDNIVLIHLSDNNSNAAAFKNAVEAATGIPTIIADKGIKIQLGVFGK